ncbi:MAG TPA: hypothetical protein VGJ84_23485 [Polyangiaceae bacterium]
MKLESRTAFLSIFASGAVALALCACGGGGDSGGGSANACPQAGSQGAVNGDKLTDFEDTTIYDYFDQTTGAEHTGPDAITTACADQCKYNNVYVGTLDATFTDVGAYADTIIQNFGLTAGHNSANAFRLQHNSLRLTAGGWGGGLYLGLSGPATGHTGISLWFKGHGWGYFRFGGMATGMSGTGGGTCEIDIPAEWTRFDIPWSSLKNDKGVSSTPATVGQIDIYMDRITAGTPALNDRNFEIIVDDIYLMK